MPINNHRSSGFRSNHWSFNATQCQKNDQWLLLKPKLLWLWIVNALQLNELSALRNTFYPEYKYLYIYTYIFILSIFQKPLLADTLKGSFSVIALLTSHITVVSFVLTLIYVCKSKLNDGLSNCLGQILRLSKEKIKCNAFNWITPHNPTDDLGDWTASLGKFANIPKLGTVVTKLSDNKKNNHPKH